MNREPTPILEFTQSQAAALSFYDGRSFRALVDAGAVLATPETRSFGRGKAKLFARSEVKVASVLNRLDSPRMNNAERRAQLGEYLREAIPRVEKFIQETGAKKITLQRPVYVLLELGPTALRATTSIAYPAPASPSLKDLFTGKWESDWHISVQLTDEGFPARSFLAANIADAVWWDNLSDEELSNLLSDQSDHTLDESDRELRIEQAYIELVHKGGGDG